MAEIMRAMILCGALAVCCTSVTVNTPSLTAKTSSVTASTQPPVTVNTSPVTANTSSVIVNTSPVTVNTPSVIVNTSPVTVNTPSVAVNTPSVNVNTSSVNFNTSSVNVNTPSVIVNTPSVAGNTSPVTVNTPSVTVNTLPVTINTPSVTVNTPSVIVNTSSVTANTPSVTANTLPPVTDNTLPVTANTPVVPASTHPSALDNTNLATSQHLRGLRTHVEGDGIVFNVNADLLADCVEGKGPQDMVDTVYLNNDSTSHFKRGTLKMDFHLGNVTLSAPGTEELVKKCSIGIVNNKLRYVMMIKLLYFEVSSDDFQINVYPITDDTPVPFNKDLGRPKMIVYTKDLLLLEMTWLRLPRTISMEMQYTVCSSEDIKIDVTMTTPVKGRVRTPFWDGVSTLDELSVVILSAYAAESMFVIDVPNRHHIMISWESIGMGDSINCNNHVLILMKSVDGLGDAGSVLPSSLPYSYCSAATPDPVLLAWRRVFVLFNNLQLVSYAGYTGFSMRFSFHNASALPQQLAADKTWNCSVAHWPDFKQHLLCDLLTQCAGGEDEADCPFSSVTCGHGYLAAGGSCFTFEPALEVLTSWVEAESACRRRGARLPTMNTPAKWRAVQDLLGHRGWDNIYIGLSSGDPSLPDLYSHFLLWSDASVAYYIKAAFLGESQCSTCAFLKNTKRPDFLHLDSCFQKVAGSLVCELDAPSILSAVVFAAEDKQLSWTNSTRCPKGHVTHTFLSCDPRSDCLTRCYTTFSDSVASLPPAFQCHNEFERVPFTLLCDHREDCSDASDEICIFPRCQEFECTNKQCIARHKLCDGVQDCLDDSDENNCSKALGYLSILDFSKPLPAMVLHDGKGLYELLDIADTYAQSTSADTRSAVEGCPDSHFQCPGVSYYCLPVYVRCNGVYDCPGHQDEVDCDTLLCPGYYRCRLSTVCLHSDHLCDGVFQCPQRDDELMCGVVCPVGCTCYGLAFYCAVPFEASRHVGLRFLDASGSGMSLKDLPYNTMLFYLSLARCNLTQLETMNFVNVFHLDLSENFITSLAENHISSYQNLQVFVIAGNPLRLILEEFPRAKVASFAKLHTLDISAVSIAASQMANLHVFSNVTNLNLSNSRLDAVSGFSVFSRLQVLDLRGCPVTYFTRSVFQGLDDLSTVYADNYKLCCPEILPAGFNVLNCHAPFDEVSSCEGLLKSGLYRVSLAVLTSMILLGNAGSFVYRVFVNKPTHKSSFGLFVTNLCLSDFLMGLYSAIIGVTDRLYLGNYVWNDVTWRKSVACKIAGVLSLVSNEVSVLIICLITVDRFLVTRFPFSLHLHFSLRSARVACITAWGVGVLLAVTPLLPMTSHWQLYSQTGICIPLPVTRRWFAGREFSFGVMIILNFVLFLVISIGQMSIYLSVKSNSMATSETTQKAKDLTIARRLITVAVSDFLCWFPVGLLGMLSSRGHPIPGEANVAIAVFVLPLNSALNPFLYTVNVILERRQKAREQRLQKIIMSRHGGITAQPEENRST